MSWKSGLQSWTIPTELAVKVKTEQEECRAAFEDRSFIAPIVVGSPGRRWPQRAGCGHAHEKMQELAFVRTKDDTFLYIKALLLINFQLLVDPTLAAAGEHNYCMVGTTVNYHSSEGTRRQRQHVILDTHWRVVTTCLEAEPYNLPRCMAHERAVSSAMGSLSATPKGHSSLPSTGEKITNHNGVYFRLL